MRRVPAPSASRRYAWPPPAFTALLITGVAFALRVVALDQESLWFDTAHSGAVALNSTVVEVVQGAASDFQSPLYFLLLHFWLKVSQEDFWLRFPTVLMGTSLVPLVYLTGKRLFSPTAGLVAAFFSALTTYQVYYSRYPRSYMLMTLLGVAAAYGLYRALQEHQARFWALHGASMVLALYTHPYAFLLLPALWGYGVWFLAKRDVGAFKPLLLTAGLVLLSYLPWVTISWRQWLQVQGGADAWIDPISRDSLKTLYDWLWFKTRAEYGPAVDLLLKGGRYLFTGLLLLAVWAGRRRPELWFTLGLLLVPISLAFLLSVLAAPLWDPRYLVLLSPFFALLVGYACWQFVQPEGLLPWKVPSGEWSRAYGLLGAVGLLMAMSVPPLGSLYLDRAFRAPELRSSSQWLHTQYREGDLILHMNYQSYLPSLWYDRQAPARASGSGSEYAIPCVWVSLPDAWCSQAPYRQSYVNLELESFSKAVQGERRVWLVALYNHNWPEEEEKTRRLVEGLRGRDFAVGRTAYFTGVQVYELVRL